MPSTGKANFSGHGWINFEEINEATFMADIERILHRFKKMFEAGDCANLCLKINAKQPQAENVWSVNPLQLEDVQATDKRSLIEFSDGSLNEARTDFGCRGDSLQLISSNQRSQKGYEHIENPGGVQDSKNWDCVQNSSNSHSDIVKAVVLSRQKMLMSTLSNRKAISFKTLTRKSNIPQPVKRPNYTKPLRSRLSVDREKITAKWEKKLAPKCTQRWQNTNKSSFTKINRRLLTEPQVQQNIPDFSSRFTPCSKNITNLTTSWTNSEAAPLADQLSIPKKSTQSELNRTDVVSTSVRVTNDAPQLVVRQNLSSLFGKPSFLCCNAASNDASIKTCSKNVKLNPSTRSSDGHRQKSSSTHLKESRSSKMRKISSLCITKAGKTKRIISFPIPSYSHVTSKYLNLINCKAN